MFRFRLVDVDGNDLGPFATSEPNWLPGHRIHRGADDALEVVNVVYSEENVGERERVDGYLVVRPV